MNCKYMKRAALLVALLSIGGTVWAQDKPDSKTEAKAERKGFSAGFDISDSANARQIGLPIYPGAKASRDGENESAAANLSVWAGAFGAKLIVMKLETADSPGKVAAYYQDALGKYGIVLDCGKDAAAEDRKKSADDDTLTCSKDKPARNGQLYKAGTRHMQHVVGIEPYGAGTRFQLLYLEAKTGD
ncbi:MAG TPA: hypothetical protein VF928_07965 [Usitatibacteraceae bacterium]